MPVKTTEDATSEETQDEETQETESEETQEVEGEETLGDAGKKALDAMKVKMRAAEKAAKDAKAALATREAELALKDKPAEEQALEQARAEARAEATAAANKRIIASELKLAAKGKLADVSDALLNINLDDFDVNDDGDVDTDALNDAISALLKRKPHLAASTGNRFEGSGDGGARATAKPKETFEEAIATATKARNFALVATLKQQQAAQAQKG